MHFQVKCRSEYSYHRQKCDFERGMWFIRNIEGSMAATAGRGSYECDMNVIIFECNCKNSSILIKKHFSFKLYAIRCTMASALLFIDDGHQLVDVNQYRIVLHINVASYCFFFVRCPVFISVPFCAMPSRSSANLWCSGWQNSISTLYNTLFFFLLPTKVLTAFSSYGSLAKFRLVSEIVFKASTDWKAQNIHIYLVHYIFCRTI